MSGDTNEMFYMKRSGKEKIIIAITITISMFNKVQNDEKSGTTGDQ